MAQKLADRYLNQAVESLLSWPALTPVALDRGVAFTAGGHEVVRLGGRNVAQLNLTRPVIDRMYRVLDPYAHIVVSPEPGWVVFHVEDSVDLGVLLMLVSVAIKANV